MEKEKDTFNIFLWLQCANNVLAASSWFSSNTSDLADVLKLGSYDLKHWLIGELAPKEELPKRQSERENKKEKWFYLLHPVNR